MNGDIYHDIRNLCNDVFCRKETLPMRFSLVSMPRPLPSSPNSTWNCGVWEHDYLQYSWIVFPHCSTVTAVSRISVNKFLVSLVSNDHISYRDDFILSLINTTWRVEWAKSYRVTLCQHNYQLSSVALFVLFNSDNSLRNFSTVQNQSHQSGNTGRSGGAICWPVQITHLLNFSSVVVNNSKNWHCLHWVWEKWRWNNTPSASSTYLVKNSRDRTHYTDLWSLLVY